MAGVLGLLNSNTFLILNPKCRQIFANMSTITTNGWDTVYATTYTVINAQIAAQWPSLTTADGDLGHITGDIEKHPQVKTDLYTSSWELMQGGSGSIVQMRLPIASGSYTGLFGDVYDLAGSDIIIQLGLAWVPEPGQIQFAISSNLSGIETDLDAETTVTANIVKAFSAGGVTLSTSSTITVFTKSSCWKIADPSSTQSFYLRLTEVQNSASLIEVFQYQPNNLYAPGAAPKQEKPVPPINPVTVISAGKFSDPEDGAVFLELIANNIDEHLKRFAFVFASVDVVTDLAKNDAWAWLQPTALGYAVVEPLANPTNDNSCFAILSMVNGQSNPQAVLQADLGAVASGCDSGLLISPTMFLTNMLYAGITSVFTNSTSADFTVDASNLSIKNVNQLNWANCTLDDGTKVSLTVGANDFAMSVQNGRVTVSFANLSYPITKLTENIGNVEINFNGQFELALKTGSNGNQTLWFDVPADQANISDVSTVINKTYYEIEEAIGVITVALSAIGLGGAAAKSIAGDAAAGALEDAGMMEANADQTEIQTAIREILEDPVAKQEFLQNTCSDALEMMQDINTTIKQANCYASIARWSARLAALTGVLLGTMEITENVLEQAAQDEWENSPPFTNFADLAISRYSFAGLSSLKVQQVKLADSLQIGFKLAS